MQQDTPSDLALVEMSVFIANVFFFFFCFCITDFSFFSPHHPGDVCVASSFFKILFFFLSFFFVFPKIPSPFLGFTVLLSK